LNGGSLLIPTDSPVRGETNMREGQVLLKNIRRSVKAGITTVILYAHWPCTAAHENHVDLLSAFWLHTKAITRVKEEVPTAFHLFSFFHFTNQGKKNTYVFDSAKFSASVIGKNALKKVS
jgi:undecaprenyl pyrophosphate synthase